MTYQETRELARIRGELRLRLMSRRYDGTSEILLRLKEAASRAPESAHELNNEYERWRVRFEMLAQQN
jgi:hypothetical protein